MTSVRPDLRRIGRRAFLATEAALALTVAGIAIRVVPSRRMVWLLGEGGSANVRAATGPAGLHARRVGFAVERVAALLPWHPVCLPQAVATRWMLTRRGIPNEAHLGVVSTSPFSAHAWVTVDGAVVQGGRAAEPTPLASFR
jgi:Transglutaminase-like superfamily